MQGFVIGACTGAIGAGVNTVVSGYLGSSLTSSIISGAIAGGITGEMFGEGFKKGAVHGAVAGAISYGVDMRYGEYASRGTYNRLVVAGLKGGLNGLARGGDFIEGFAYGFAYGLAYDYGAKYFGSKSPVPDGVGGAEDNGYQEYISMLEICDEQITILNLQLENKSLTPEQRELIEQEKNEWLQFKVRVKNSIPKFIWPTTGRITSRFTLWRESKKPEVYPSGRHRAIDIGNEVGTPIVAIADGTVTKITPNNQWSGNIIEIDYGNGFTSSFHHLNGFARNIAEGDKVLQGQVVGYMGETGEWCDGPHLHFELRYNGQLVNPEDYLPKFR